MQGPVLTLSLATLALLAACGTDPKHAADLPSLGLSHHAEPLPGVHTAGQPTEAQFARLPELGVRRVITLRPATESGTGWEEEAARKIGVEVVRLPIAGSAGLTRENVERFAAELGKGDGQTTLVCCGSSNRVGALFALKAAWLDGKSPQDAIAFGKTAGMAKLETKVQELLQPEAK